MFHYTLSFNIRNFTSRDINFLFDVMELLYLSVPKTGGVLKCDNVFDSERLV